MEGVVSTNFGEAKMKSMKMALLAGAAVAVSTAVAHADELADMKAQIETLKRYRADGEQKVTVQHQHVNVSANQAVVGINQGGGGAHEKSSQSHVLGKSEAASPPNASGAALLSHEQAVPMPMPGAGSEGQEGVPVPRCESGRAEGEGKRCMAAWNGDQ